jgi:hypothetical protein
MDEGELKTLMGDPFQNYETICQLNAAMTYLSGAGSRAGSEESLKGIVKAMSATRDAILSEYCADCHSWNTAKKELLSNNKVEHASRPDQHNTGG